MSRPLRNPGQWPAYPDIPIFLDTSDQRATTKSYGTTPTTPTTPEILAQSRTTHLQLPHMGPHPTSPVNASPTTTIETSSHRSVVWPIPEPPPEVVQQQQIRRPLLRFFPTDRPRVRLDGISSAGPAECSSKKYDIAYHSKLDHGLGILGGPPKPPSIRVQPPPFENEKAETTTNIAQRIEQKLWSWNDSGNIMEQWMLEIISWLISAICMSAIIAVLVVLRDKPTSKWPFDGLGLTLNTFVSVLSRIAGAALLLPVAEALGQLKWSWFIKGNSKKMWDFEMFDNASRGPWGALLLLIHTRGKTIAALGALVTIFCLALDPFFQQVVAFPERWQLQAMNSSIPRAVRYEPQYPKEFISGEVQAQLINELVAVADPFFIGNGTPPIIFGNGSRADIPLLCPTSHCTWPAYDTLGVCSQCVETPDLLTFACLRTRVDWTSDLNATIASYPNATVCGHFLNATSEEPVLMSGYMVDDAGEPFGEALLMRTLPLVTNAARERLWAGSINFQQVRNPIVDVLISSSMNRSQVFANAMPVIHECVVTWCVKTIESSYTSASYHENVTNMLVNDTSGDYPWKTTKSGLNEVTDYLENVTISAPPTTTNFSEFGWGVNNETMLNMVVIFDRLFPAFTTASDEASPLLRWRTGHPTMVRTRELDWNPWLLPNNVTRHMERLTEALSNTIRSAPGNEMIYGEAYDRETYVSVRWPWMTLPLGLLIISFIFLLATVVKSASEKDQVGIRKNSAIATLLYGLPDHYQKRLGKSNSRGTPRAKAKNLKVKLSPTTGWRVSGNVFSPMTPTMPKNLPPPGWI
ncbi:hypothetical protein J1614_010163 [Plenodomus biglobosus]|nr:hypothetical protein J1614_010163 [Plenodomus biglobosus]